MSFRTLSVCLAVVVTSAAASAATITVSKGGAIQTIQAGVDAAGPNDNVVVKAGTYDENVVIPAGKNGLTLKAKGKVVLDAHPAGGTVGNGPGITIGSDGVSVIGFDIRNPLPDAGMTKDGDGISLAATGVTITKCRIVNCWRAGVFTSAGQGLRVTNCTISHCHSALNLKAVGLRVTNVVIEDCDLGMQLDADGARVEKCTVRRTTAFAMDIDADDCRIQKNVITNCDSGLGLTGLGGVVTRNTVSGVWNDGMSVANSNLVISRNRISDVDGNGIDSSGAGATVTRNRVEHCNDDGIRIATADSCTITRNDVTGVLSFGIEAVNSNLVIIEKNVIRLSELQAIFVVGTASNISNNRILDCASGSPAIDLSGAGAGSITKNTLVGSGAPGILLRSDAASIEVEQNDIRGSRDGILAQGAQQTVRDNELRDCTGDGIFILAATASVTGNRVENCVVDGIDVQGVSAVTVSNNTVRNCGAEGIENSATGTTVTNNKATGNRIDFANDGAASTFTGNTSSDGTGNAPVPPEVD